ncbi:MAG: Ig-like domain-containing protein [Clostridia bacterium]|nr:Ig-like domain-containing protein [Clostridia bacterium]
MKRLKKLTSVFLAVVMAIGVLAIAPLTVSAAGNTMATATNYTLGSNVSGSITKSNEKDFYKFTIPTSGRIKLDINAEISEAYYRIYDADGNAMFDNRKYWNNTTEVMKSSDNIDLTAGTYYFNIADSWGSTGNYNFKISFTSANESFKETGYGQDNALKDANSISLNKTYKGQIATNDEKDFYKFTLSTSGRIKLDINAEISEAYYRIYDADGNAMFDNRKYWNDTTEVMKSSDNIDLTAGTYYFNIERNWGRTGNYNFKISFTSANESFKETGYGTNNTLKDANSISLNKTYKGQIATNDDKDFYKFKVSKSGKVKLNVDSKIYCAYYRIYDENGNAIFDTKRYWDDKTELMKMRETIDLKAGTYYFNVEKDWRNRTGTYSFSIVQAVNPTSVKLSQTSLTLGVGESYTLKKSVTPSNATTGYTWSSSNTKVATVSNGVVRAKSTGIAYIKVKTSNGKTSTCKVTVKAAPKSVKLSRTSIGLGVGESYTVSASVNSGSYANAANLKWSTSNSRVAVVTKGSGSKAKITAKGVGTAYIKVRLYNGKTATCKITVKAAPKTVKLSKTSIALNRGSSYTISETVNGGACANTANIKWTSSNSKVATVTKSSGNKAIIKAKSKGTAYIKVTLYNGKTAQCKVTVK